MALLAVLLNKDGTYQATLRYRGQDRRWPTSSAWSICRLNLLLSA
jgi:hypothetical protein